MREIIADKSLTARGVYGFWPAQREGEDIVLFTDERRSKEAARFAMLRQQAAKDGEAEFRSLVDFVAPKESGHQDYVGAFAVTAGLGCDALAKKKFEAAHDDYSAIIVKALADRLAEAFAEWMHREARKQWGYGADEDLSNEDPFVAENPVEFAPRSATPPALITLTSARSSRCSAPSPWGSRSPRASR